MSKGRQKRSQCDVCPKIKRVVVVTIHGRKMSLCESCRLAFSRLVRESEAKKARAKTASGKIVTAAAAGHVKPPTQFEELQKGYPPLS